MTKAEFITMERDSGIEIGDEVIVLKKCHDYENSWGTSWNESSMTPCIGQIHTVIGHRPGTTTGFQLDTQFWFPFFVLEKVNKVDKRVVSSFIKKLSDIIISNGGDD